MFLLKMLTHSAGVQNVTTRGKLFAEDLICITLILSHLPFIGLASGAESRLLEICLVSSHRFEISL